LNNFSTATTLQNLDGSSGNNNNKDDNNNDNNNDKDDDMQQMPSLSTNELTTTKKRMADATFICNKNHHRCHHGVNHRVPSAPVQSPIDQRMKELNLAMNDYHATHV
jgi:hypothetical protein